MEVLSILGGADLQGANTSGRHAGCERGRDGNSVAVKRKGGTVIGEGQVRPCGDKKRGGLADIKPASSALAKSSQYIAIAAVARDATIEVVGIGIVLDHNGSEV